MIKASELRIGNWVYKDLSIDDIELRQVLPGDIIYVAIEEEGGEDFMSYQPVALTEEWLHKFGFSTTQWDDFNSHRLMVGDNDYTIVIYSDGNCEVGDIVTLKIKSVHQLQNLYFALSGKELEIKK